MSVEELARKTDIPVITIRYYEILEKFDCISKPRIQRLERALGIKLEEDE